MASWEKVLAVVAISAVVCKAVYNVAFHPLRRYPGPLPARVSRLYYAYHLWRGTYCTKVLELHEKYGSALRIAPDELSYANAQAWRDIYGQTFGRRKADLEKDRSFYMVAPNGADSIITAPYDVHRRFRRLLSVALSDRALMRQEVIIQSYINLLIERLRKNVEPTDRRLDRPIDISRWLEYTYFDILGDLAFGEPFGCLDKGESHWWMDTLQAGVKAAFRLKTIERFIPGFFPAFMGLMGFIGAALNQDLEGNFNFCVIKARERLNRSSDRPDFITYITEANKKIGGMTRDEIESNSQVLVNAGTEPVATATCGILFYLLSSTHAVERLVDEIRSAFKSETDITITATHSLPYLQAVIKEGIRLYPPLPAGFPRTTPPGGCKICGDHIPGGYSVSVAQSAANCSPALWIEPDQFTPERWLGDPRYDADDRDAYQPFSLGPRNCMGKSLAQAEMSLVLSRLFWNFDIGIAPESANWGVGQKTFPLWDKPALYTTLTNVV